MLEAAAQQSASGDHLWEGNEGESVDWHHIS